MTPAVFYGVLARVSFIERVIGGKGFSQEEIFNWERAMRVE
jgi:hypothetical protein